MILTPVSVQVLLVSRLHSDPTPIPVPILLLSRLHFAPITYSCPDSPTIETAFCSYHRFLSRFTYYRDCILLISPVPVPIPLLSRLYFAPITDSCPDSPTIETAFCSYHLFLSQFPYYRDCILLLSPVPVLILLLSRLHFAPITDSCPDFPTIETAFCSYHRFLSQFTYYRDCILFLSPILVPIHLLSRLHFVPITDSCPDSPTIENAVSPTTVPAPIKKRSKL